MSAVMTYKDDDTGLEFQWHGGEYIEIGHTAAVDTGPFNNKGQPSYYAGDFMALDVINVWDHANGVAEISGFDEFEHRCERWLAENLEHAIW